MRFFLKQLLFLTFWSSGPVLALGLGDIRLYSYLNDHLRAEIQLLSIGEAEPGDFKLRLIEDRNERRDYEPNAFALRSLRFDIVRPNGGQAVIRVTSAQRVREPIVAFVLELTAPNVVIQRDYTLLLDPAPYITNPISKGTTATGQITRGRTPKPAPPREREADSVYGPVRDGDTLSHIALRTRPSRDVSIYRMTRALHRRNPEAFINGDIDRLRKGARLEVPSLQEIRGTSVKVEAGSNKTAVPVETYPVRAANPTTVDKTPVRPSSRPSQKTRPAEQKSQDVLRLVTEHRDAPGVIQPGAQRQRLNTELKEVSQNLKSVREENRILKARVAQMELLLRGLREQALRMVATQQSSGAAAAKSKPKPKPKALARVETPSVEPKQPQQTPTTVGDWAKSLFEWLWWTSLVLAVAVVVFALLLLRRKDEFARARRDSFATTSEFFEESIQRAHDVNLPTEEAAAVGQTREAESAEQPKSKIISNQLAGLRTEIDTNAAYGRYAAAKAALEQALALAPSDIELMVKAFELARLQEDVESFTAWVGRAGHILARRAPAIWRSIIREGRVWIPDHPIWQQFKDTSAEDEDTSSEFEETRSYAAGRKPG